MITFVASLMSRLSLCAKVGFFAGAIAGLALSLTDLFYGGIVLTNQDAVHLSLALAIFSWLFLLFFLGVVFRYSFQYFALPTLFNSLLTTFVTVFIVKYLDAFPLAWLLGMIIGILIGSLLCRIQYLLKPKK